MGLSSFINRHKGATAWIFGKGPSLSLFNFQTAGEIRLALNDVAHHVPGCLYCFANDGVKRWRDLYREGQTLFQPRRCLWEFDSTLPDAVACDVVVFDDDYDIDLTSGPERLSECLSILDGTLCSALQVAAVMGIKTLHMVGIDGGGSHAPGIQWRTELRRDHAKEYNRIRSKAIETADLLGIELIFFNPNPRTKMNSNGKITVKFIRNAAAGAQHFAQGTIASFPPKIAAELIGASAAEVVNIHEPEKASEPLKVETASEPIEAAESSVLETKKAKTVSKKKGK